MIQPTTASVQFIYSMYCIAKSDAPFVVRQLLGPSVDRGQARFQTRNREPERGTGHVVQPNWLKLVRTVGPIWLTLVRTSARMVMRASRRSSDSGSVEAGLIVSSDFHAATAARIASEFLDASTLLSFDTVPVMAGPSHQLFVGGGCGWKGSYHHQSARSPVGPGHGATAGGGFVGGRASDAALSGRPALSVTVRLCAGPAMVMTPR